MRRSMILVWLIVCAALHGAAFGIGPDDGEPTPFPAAGLTLVLSVDKSALLVGEPVQLQLRVENHGNQAITGDLYPTVDMDRVRLTTTPEHGAPASYVSEAMAIAAVKKRGAPLATIEPGGMISGVAFVSYDAIKREFAFAAAGRYELQAALDYDFHRQQLVSNSVALQVTAPAALDAQALGFIQAHGLKHLLTAEAGLFPIDHAAIARLRAFLMLHAASTYASYARTGLDAICQTGLDPLACAPLRCTGDCSGDGTVTIEELIRGVNIALGAAADQCAPFDCNATGQVTIDCLVQAVAHALNGCPPAPAGAK